MERRRDYRVRARIHVLSPKKLSGGTGKARITNIGPKGAFIQSDKILPVGTRLTLIFRLPRGLKRYRIGGVIRWTRGGGSPGLGVEFVGIGNRASEEIADWVLKRRSRKIR